MPIQKEVFSGDKLMTGHIFETKKKKADLNIIIRIQSCNFNPYATKYPTWKKRIWENINI
jgi:hypothetical protein